MASGQRGERRSISLRCPQTTFSIWTPCITSGPSMVASCLIGASTPSASTMLRVSGWRIEALYSTQLKRGVSHSAGYRTGAVRCA